MNVASQEVRTDGQVDGGDPKWHIGTVIALWRPERLGARDTLTRIVGEWASEARGLEMTGTPSGEAEAYRSSSVGTNEGPEYVRDESGPLLAECPRDSRSGGGRSTGSSRGGARSCRDGRRSLAGLRSSIPVEPTC